MTHHPPVRGRTVAIALALALLSGCAVEDGGSIRPTSSALVVDPRAPLEAQMAEAIQAGDLELAERTIEAGLDLEADVQSGLPALHYALQLDRGEIVVALLDAGAAIDDRDSQGRTPLMVGASFAGPEAIRALLDAGAEPNAGNPVNLMAAPLTYAAVWNNVPAIEALLDAGAEIDAVDLGNSTALLYAAQGGQLEAVECLLARGADPSIRDTDHNSTPRDWALFHADLDVVAAIDAATDNG